MVRRVTLEEASKLEGQLRHWSYCAADTLQTSEVQLALAAQLELRPRCQATYRAQMAYQSPAMAINLRGVRVDLKARAEVLAELAEEIEEKGAAVGGRPEVQAVWDGKVKESGACKASKRKDGRHSWQKWIKGEPEDGRTCTMCGSPRLRIEPFNANSSAQARHLFHDLLGVRRGDMRNKKGEFSADDEVLERIGKKYPKLAELVEDIQHVRDLAKQRGELNARLSDVGRYHTSMSIGSTWSGRSSSSKNAFGLGGNIQNKAERHRRMFIADPGWVLLNADLKQAESLIVAHLAEDEAYIHAHESGDVHTHVTKAIWTELPWTGDLKRDKEIAKQNPPWDAVDGHDYRWYGKRNTHGYAYGISPSGTARQARAPLRDAEFAHGQLDKAFPGIKGTYHPGVIARIKAGQPIVTKVGREILLMGRPWDSATWRQGFAAEPQSIVADVMWLACWRLWHEHDREDGAPQIQLLQNGYDSLLCQCRAADVDAAVEAVVWAMSIPILMPSGRAVVIPPEVAASAPSGNWGKRSASNPLGLRNVYG